MAIIRSAPGASGEAARAGVGGVERNIPRLAAVRYFRSEEFAGPVPGSRPGLPKKNSRPPLRFSARPSVKRKKAWNGHRRRSMGSDVPRGLAHHIRYLAGVWQAE